MTDEINFTAPLLSSQLIQNQFIIVMNVSTWRCAPLMAPSIVSGVRPSIQVCHSLFESKAELINFPSLAQVSELLRPCPPRSLAPLPRRPLLETAVYFLTGL